MPGVYEINQQGYGQVQEILDEVFNIEADATPVLSMLPTGKKPNNSLATWVAEVIPARPFAGVLDGTPATSFDKTPRYVLSGCIQQFREAWSVTKRAELTTVAGVKSEAAHQMALKIKQIKRQMEAQILSNLDSAQESGATPWTTRGMLCWLDTSAQTNHPVNAALLPASATRSAATMANLTQTAFSAILQAAYAAKKSAVSLEGIVGASLRAQIDTYTEVWPVASTTSQPMATYNKGTGRAYERRVDVLRFSFGEVRLHLSEYLACTSADGLQTAYSPYSGVFVDLREQWDLGWWQKPSNENLPPDGSGKRGVIDSFLLLRCKHPQGQASVYSNNA